MINSQDVIDILGGSLEQAGGLQPTTRFIKSDLSRLSKDVEENNKIKFYYHKVTKKGRYVELFESERPTFYNFTVKASSFPAIQELDQEKIKEKKERNRKRNAYRSKSKVIDLAMCNFTEKDKFLTLTYDGLQNFDIKNIKESNKRFTLFIRKLRRMNPNLKYIAVIEFQDKNRGAVHYHLIYNLPYVHWSIIKKLWSHGDINIKRPKDMRHITFYIPKYFGKNAEDERFNGRRSFMYSKNLTKPRKILGFHAQNLGEQFKKSLVVVNRQEYISDFHGKVTKTLYTYEKSSAPKDQQ